MSALTPHSNSTLVFHLILSVYIGCILWPCLVSLSNSWGLSGWILQKQQCPPMSGNASCCEQLLRLWVCTEFPAIASASFSWWVYPANWTCWKLLQGWKASDPLFRQTCEKGFFFSPLWDSRLTALSHSSCVKFGMLWGGCQHYR